MCERSHRSPSLPVANRDELLQSGLSLDGRAAVHRGRRATWACSRCARAKATSCATKSCALLQEITANLSFALQYRQQEDAIQQLAYFDPLTGLAKRALFCERLDELLADGAGPAMRPDRRGVRRGSPEQRERHFGRHVGDLLLREVAERVKHQLDDDEALRLSRRRHVRARPAAAGILRRERHGAARERRVPRPVRHRGPLDARVVQVRHRALRRRLAKTATRSCSVPKRRSSRRRPRASSTCTTRLQMHSELAERLVAGASAARRAG